MEISDFLESISHPLLEKKHISKKTGKLTAVHSKPLKDMHDDFIKTGAGNVSFTQFANCRPAHIHTSQKAHLRTCLCSRVPSLPDESPAESRPYSEYDPGDICAADSV